jgi:glutaredoxin-like YruB-family protein
MTDNKVIIYSTPWCAFCKTEKQYLDHLGVAFEVKDIEEDAAAFEELAKKTDGRTSGVPVTDIGGELIFGFDRKKIDDTLKAQGLLASA